MGAIISECGKYRYLLTRETGLLLPEKPGALFVMLNPSTADAALDDPTIRRCRGFATAWGCAGLAVGNLYAYRATNPQELWRCSDPVGPENDQRLADLAAEYGDIVCAWGGHAKPDRVAAVVGVLQGAGARLWCLGTNNDGSPKHPLYIKQEQQLLAWTPNVSPRA
ncbi:DUF1643 domain-containing protein [Pseudomonas nicosulfuronedens]|uniref:DUF1643 domain-containing protein n=1 Tax=Pseudomonas nicosulfuronedens TaxID=2571105 RepID=UPI0024491E07|nr:DUF1643 domain-containing protein [Pseudomonas nicosulfuronedens]MDH1009945.1 DUF1643 domain-containing protein [Pseudomonas nicosulfuronedens]MDH1978921.1 DUF1643 domain-containing protein [Pseudomonas nicosulfuronedens]MDH2028400.1 DUF1643 domain-containing protein [Pseudomonas nicosulfuronedens]